MGILIRLGLRANECFTNATEFLLKPDHYLLRMLYSQGVPMQALGITQNGSPSTVDPKDAWRKFASNYYLFAGTPCQIWLDHSFAEVFGLEVRLSADTADHYFEQINANWHRTACALAPFSTDLMSSISPPRMGRLTILAITRGLESKAGVTGCAYFSP